MKINGLLRAKAAFDAKDYSTAIKLARVIYYSKARREIVAEAGHLLMICYVSIGDYEAGERFYNFVRSYFASNHVFLVNAAVLFKYKKDYATSLHLCANAMRLKPDYPDSYFVAGAVQDENGDPENALELYHKGFELEPRNAIHTNIGNALENLGQRDEAKAEHLKAVTANPDQLEGYINLANIANKERDYQYCEALYNRVLEREPEHGAARMGLAHIQLMREQWTEGWDNYRWRFLADNSARKFPWPELSGDSINKDRVLIVFEQGYGDCFMAARWLQKFNASLTKMNCPDDMQDIISQMAWGIQFIGKMPQKELERSFDSYIHIMDLFRLFKFDGKQTNIAYLGSGSMTATNDTIGYCWKGRQKPDPKRSIPFDEFKRLVFPVAETVSLQLDATDTERRNFTRGITVSHDWIMTMREIERCNLIITIDTAIAHLASAMGKYVWCLVPYAADWRYGLPNEASYRMSKFYTNQRIYQQDEENDWRGVIERVRSDLKNWLGIGQLERPPVEMGIRE